MKRLPIVLALGLLILTAFPSAAPPRQAATDTEIASRADALMTGLFTSGRFNGTVLLARNGKVAFEKGYGMANFEWDIPNRLSTKFRLVDTSLLEPIGAATFRCTFADRDVLLGSMP